MEFLIITGLSGAGKSRAADVLEDLDYYCVDNMPVALIPRFADFCAATKGRYEKVALVTDVREKDGFGELLSTSPVREKADFVVNTAGLTLGKLQSRLYELLCGEEHKREIDVTVLSFGYKHGLPSEADLVFDARFLPNPFYVDELRPQSGLDLPVKEYVFSFQQTRTFMEKLEEMLEFLLPLYIEEGKSSLTVAIGCTGGRHRSVAIAAALNDHFVAKGIPSVNVNRDIDK